MAHSFIRAYRRRYALTQDQLADLLGVSRDIVYRLERGTTTPDLILALKLEFIFAVPVAALYPSLNTRLEERVMRHAKELYEALEGRTDRCAAARRELLERMARQDGEGSSAAAI